MAKDKTPRRPRAETPKGFRDQFGPEVTERDAMLRRIAEVYRMHGFDPLETSAVETVEALGKFLPDVDRPNEGVFAWQEDEDADWLALRYDLTAPLARVYAQHRASLPTPYRRYAMGPVWRNEKPGPGRFRQFYQCDADTVGTPTVAADAEIIGMLCEALEAAGIAGTDYVVKINNRKVLNGVLERLGLTEEPLRRDGPITEDEAVTGLVSEMVRRNVETVSRMDVLRTVDKFDKVGIEGVRQLLTTGRKDASGAFIEGVGLPDDQAWIVLQFLGAKGSTTDETLANLRSAVFGSRTGEDGVVELEQIIRLLRADGYGEDRVVIDPSTVRGLGYYTGPVFEAELTFEVLGDDGKPRQFGSVAGGGRYDDLVKRFTGEAVPATGVSIGVDRLLAALRATGRVEAEGQGPVVVTVMDRDRVGDALALAAELRRAGIRAEAYLGNPKSFGAQMKYADRRRSPFAIIEGSDEKARGVVQVKDLVAGAQAAETASLEEWKDRPAQVEVPRGEVAAHLKRLLAK